MILSRKIIPVKDYKRFDLDGWSKDLVLGLRIRDGFISDARIGALLDDGEFYDADGNGFLATHLLVLKRDDLTISGGRIKLKKKALWTPTKEQIGALTKVVKKLPYNEELKGLLKDLKNYAR